MTPETALFSFVGRRRSSARLAPLVPKKFVRAHHKQNTKGRRKGNQQSKTKSADRKLKIRLWVCPGDGPLLMEIDRVLDRREIRNRKLEERDQHAGQRPAGNISR